MTTGSRSVTLSDGTTVWKSWSGSDRPTGSKAKDFHPYEMQGGFNRQHRSIFKADGSPLSCEQLVWQWSPGSNKIFGANVLPADGDWTESDEGELLRKLASAVKGTSFHAGNFLATLPKAVGQTRSTLYVLIESIRSLRRGDLTGALKGVGLVAGQRKKKWMIKKLDQGDISSVWLAMQYGWVPLLKDVFDIWQLVVREASEKDTRKLRFKVRSGRSFDYEGSTVPSVASCPGSASVSTVLIYDLHAELSWHTALGLSDPGSVLWERVPFSFVADWFIPIAAYLEQLAVIPRLQGEWCRSLRRRFEATEGVIFGGSVCVGQQSASFKATYLTRTTGTSALAVPKPRFKPLNKALSTAHIKNGIALLHQLTLSKVRKL